MQNDIISSSSFSLHTQEAARRNRRSLPSTSTPTCVTAAEVDGEDIGDLSTACTLLAKDFRFLREAKGLFSAEGERGQVRHGELMAALHSLLEGEAEAQDGAFRRFLPPEDFPEAYR